MRRAALGLPSRTVLLVPHDPRWAELFVFEADRLKRTCGEALIAIEHVGSTAVSGIDTKPVLDMLLGVPKLDRCDALLRQLLTLGYVHRPDDLLPERLYAVRDDGGLRTHHAHICEVGSGFWRDHLRFRDALRSDVKLAADYMKLKHDLARRHRTDRIAYTNAKAAFIASALGGS